MALPPFDSLSPSGSQPPSPDKASDLLDFLRKPDVLASVGPEATDLKIISCYLKLHPSEFSTDPEKPPRFTRWIVQNKESLISASQLTEENLVSLSEIFTSLAKIKQSKNYFIVTQQLFDSLFEIAEKYCDMNPSMKGSFHQICLINEIEVIGSEINKGKKPIPFMRLTNKVALHSQTLFPS